MEDGEREDSSDELEVVEMLGVDVGVGIDLKRVVVVRRVLEEAVEGVEHFVREEEEEFPSARSCERHSSIRETVWDPPRESSVIESILAVKLDHEPLLEVVGGLAHNLGVTVLKDVRTANLDVALSR